MKQVIHEEGSRPVKIWTEDVEDSALQQLKNIAKLPFIHPHGVAAMPDVHFGIGATVGSVIADVWLTRKGAIRARKGDLGIIPGSMGQRSYIVRGKGNPDSYHSCSHGAGRKMGRKEARRHFTVADLEAQTQGVECRKDDAVLDEIPGSYKDIDTVMANQADLVEVVHTLKQVLCVKGA